jgi:polyisoprenoid-binding protein YceI|tara:strand:+ start:2375 stop:3052 length:678 start_codon:yes stop_codon:yes gene_type:complete
MSSIPKPIFLKLFILSAFLILGCSGKKKIDSSSVKKEKQSKVVNSIQLKKGKYNTIENSSEVLWECMWLGGAKHNGSVNLISGKLDVRENAEIEGTFIVDLASMNCFDLKNEGANKKLISHLKSDDFFDVKNHPKAFLKLLSAENIGGNDFRFNGELTIKGKTNPIVFQGKVTEHSPQYEADLYLVFDRSKYDVRYRSASLFSDLGDRIIADDVKLNVKVKLQKN